MGYLFTAKEDLHKYLYEEIASLEKLGEVHFLERKLWTGRKHQIWRYRWVNGVRLRNSDDSLNVNWIELTISAEDGKKTFHTACIGSHMVSEQNAEDLVQAARTRWKIENEDINTLKTKGYHFEHNFGHGKQFLTQTLLSLNLIAFLFHTVLELTDWSSPDFVDTLISTCVSVSEGVSKHHLLAKRNHGLLRVRFLLHRDVLRSSRRLPLLKLLIFGRCEVAEVRMKSLAIVEPFSAGQYLHFSPHGDCFGSRGSTSSFLATSLSA